MRKLINFILIIALFAPYSFAREDSDYFEGGYARMSYVKGDVYIQRAEDLGYEEGVVNLALIQGDKIGTREGRTEIHLGEGNYIRIDRNTQIELVKMPDKREHVTGVHLLSGNIFLRINFLNNEKSIEIHTPDASFYLVEAGLYYLSIKQNNQTEIKVFEGRAEAAGEEGSLLLGAEEKLVVSNGRFISEPTYFYPSMNSSFAEWNSSRDAFHNRYASGTRYLPSELSEYESELAHYGQWNYHNSYGYVWVPQRVSVSWRPYMNGRWVWYPIIGWTWVSYEPWGWCVSHYGRWHWSVRLGWYWIPTRRWGPAWVHWYHGLHHIGWCPLSYYGYPGVVINNHYYGNYYHHYYPSGSRALTVIHKDQLQARNISKVALSRSRASKLSQISMSPAQPETRPLVSKTELRISEAAKVFSTTKIRRVTKAYSPGNSLRSTHVSGSKSIPRASDVKLDSHSIRTRTKSTAVQSSKTDIRRTYQPRSSGSSDTRNSLMKGRGSNNKNVSDIKTYPSRKINNVTRSHTNSSPVNRSSRMQSSKSSVGFDSSRSKQNRMIKSYPSRKALPKSRQRSSRSINSTKRRSSSYSRNRSILSSTTKSSIRNRSVPRISGRTNIRNRKTSSSSLRSSRNRSFPKISSRTNRRSMSSSRSISTSRRKIRSSSSSRRISSRPKTRSSSSRVRSSSSRVRRSSSARSRRVARTKSSSRSSSKSRVKKK